MFRFKFVSAYAAWVVQLKSAVPFVWMTVKDQNGDIRFDNLKAAQEYAALVGLPDHYAEQAAPKSKANFIEHGVQVVLAPPARP